MSVFSIIGVVTLVIILIAGTTIKIVLSKRRKKLEGFHGFVHEDKPEENKTDDWELL